MTVISMFLKKLKYAVLKCLRNQLMFMQISHIPEKGLLSKSPGMQGGSQKVLLSTKECIALV